MLLRLLRQKQPDHHNHQGQNNFGQQSIFWNERAGHAQQKNETQNSNRPPLQLEMVDLCSGEDHPQETENNHRKAKENQRSAFDLA